MKESYFFSHDYNARQDPKMQELLMDFGVAGIGVYWCIIEQLYEQGGRMPLSSIKAIAFVLHVGIDDVRNIIENYGLFENDGVEFWSPSATRRIESRQKTSEKRSKAIAKRWSKDTKTEENDTNVSKHDTNVLQNEDNAETLVIQKNEKSGFCNTIKVNKIKEKEIKENNIFIPNDCECSQEEKQRILEIFYFDKNFVNPHDELDRFVNHYDANGWCRNGSNVPVKDKRALARSWKPQQAGAHFPKYFIEWLFLVYAQALEREPAEAKRIMQLEKFDMVGDKRITIYCSQDVANIIERNVIPTKEFKLSYKIAI